MFKFIIANIKKPTKQKAHNNHPVNQWQKSALSFQVSVKSKISVSTEKDLLPQKQTYHDQISVWIYILSKADNQQKLKT